MMIIAMVAKTTGSLKSIMHENAVIHADSGKLVIHHLVLFVRKEISKPYLIILNESERFCRESLPKHDNFAKPGWLSFLHGAQKEIFSRTSKLLFVANESRCRSRMPWMYNSFCAPCEEERR